jgi:hypothetical protein
MLARYAMVIAAVCAASPAHSQAMNADTARRFVVGKLFAFTCFDGSRGAGRIYGDGSVIGSVQMGGNGQARAMWMPAGTLRVKGEAVCASIKGMLFEPCFTLTRTGDQSFRGAVSGMGFAYCDFTRRNAAVTASPRALPSRPASLQARAIPGED